MDNINPQQMAQAMLDASARKLAVPGRHLFLRGCLAGGLLAYATTVAMIAAIQTATPLVGALVFPVGFVLIVLLGCDLVTGSFALAPLGRVVGKATTAQALTHIAWVLAGNLVGSVAFAGMLVLTLPHSGGLADKLVAVAEAKTLAYAAAGPAGLLTAMVKAMLCNWMVTLGVVMSLSSASTLGKIAAMWLPIFMFFALGFEHLVVNLFVLPAGLMLGAKVGIADCLLWNLLPVTVGNFIGGFVFTGLALHATWGPARAPAPAPAPARDQRQPIATLAAEPALK